MNNDVVYLFKGNATSEQAEASSSNPLAGNIQTRTLAELQVISLLLHRLVEPAEDLRQLRQNASDSIT